MERLPDQAGIKKLGIAKVALDTKYRVMNTDL
jgi:hypothetical protein